jgi:hypothetical protein
MVLVGNTEEIFSESGQHFNQDIHLPTMAASVAHRIAFGPNAGQPVRRLKTQTLLWPSKQNFKSTSTACVSAGGYRTGDIYQTSQLHSSTPNMRPMGRI